MRLRSARTMPYLFPGLFFTLDVFRTRRAAFVHRNQAAVRLDVVTGGEVEPRCCRYIALTNFSRHERGSSYANGTNALSSSSFTRSVRYRAPTAFQCICDFAHLQRGCRSGDGEDLRRGHYTRPGGLYAAQAAVQVMCLPLIGPFGNACYTFNAETSSPNIFSVFGRHCRLPLLDGRGTTLREH
jgi:hypothetical protein